MLQTLKLLLPALIPSWRFFDTIAPSPRIEFALLKTARDASGRWQEFRPRPARLPISTMLKRMFWNPRWNESLFLVSCAERLMESPTEHSSQEILARIEADPPRPDPGHRRARCRTSGHRAWPPVRARRGAGLGEIARSTGAGRGGGACWAPPGVPRLPEPRPPRRAPLRARWVTTPRAFRGAGFQEQHLPPRIFGQPGRRDTPSRSTPDNDHVIETPLIHASTLQTSRVSEKNVVKNTLVSLGAPKMIPGPA